MHVPVLVPERVCAHVQLEQGSSWTISRVKLRFRNQRQRYALTAEALNEECFSGPHCYDTASSERVFAFVSSASQPGLVRIDVRPPDCCQAGELPDLAWIRVFVPLDRGPKPQRGRRASSPGAPRSGCSGPGVHGKNIIPLPSVCAGRPSTRSRWQLVANARCG